MSLVVSAVSRSRKTRVERPPEERVDAALDVDEDEQYGGEPVEQRSCPCPRGGSPKPGPRRASSSDAWRAPVIASLTAERQRRHRPPRGFETRAGRTYDPPVGVLAWPSGGASNSRLGDAARVTLAGIRLFNGAMGLVAPAMAARRIGTPEGAPLYPWRMFGIRTVIIGAELLARDREQRDRAVRLALPIHASDTVSAALGGLLGETSKRTSLLLTAISGTNTVLALLARRTLR